MNPINTLTVILARGGSKGLPRKNALPLAGRPMLAWTIEHALQSELAGLVVLSTDDDELADIAREHDVQVVPRPAELAGDTATVDSAARNAVEAIETQRGESFDPIVILYGNVPVRPPDLLDRAVNKLRDTGCDSVQSVCTVGKMHPYWMKTLDGDQLNAYTPNDVCRRQDLPPVYMLDGGIIAVRRESLFRVDAAHPHAFLGDDRRAIVTQPGEVVDVDSELDMRVAEAVLLARAEGVR